MIQRKSELVCQEIRKSDPKSLKKAYDFCKSLFCRLLELFTKKVKIFLSELRGGLRIYTNRWNHNITRLIFLKHLARTQMHKFFTYFSLFCQWFFILNLNAADILPVGDPVSNWYSRAYGVSADGQVVVGRLSTRAMSFTPGSNPVSLTPINTISDQDTAYDISADGKTIIGASIGGYSAIWNQSGMIKLSALPGATETIASGVSSDGSVVVGVSGNYGFRWTKETGMVNLGNFAAWDVSGDGNIIVGDYWLTNGSTTAMYWTASSGIVKFLEGYGNVPSNVNSISLNGKYIVGGYNGNGFFWSTDSGMKQINFEANSVSNDGYIAVGRNLSNGYKATIWNNNTNTGNELLTTLKNMNLKGISDWTSLDNATAIAGDNTNGYTIVGYGKHINNFGSTSFMIRNVIFPVPEPSTWVSAFIAGSILMILIRKNSNSKSQRSEVFCTSLEEIILP